MRLTKDIRMGLEIIQEQIRIAKQFGIFEDGEDEVKEIPSVVKVDEKQPKAEAVKEKPNKFERGELKKLVKMHAKRESLKYGITVDSKKVLYITNQIKKEGYDFVKMESVASTLRRLGYCEELKKY